MVRAHTGGENEEGTFSFYCRQCGEILKLDNFPDYPCPWCGQTLDDRGWGVSGDASATTTSDNTSQPNRGFTVTSIDKQIY